MQHTRPVAHARHAPERTRTFKPTLLTISHARAHVRLHRAHCNAHVWSHTHGTLLSAHVRTHTSHNITHNSARVRLHRAHCSTHVWSHTHGTLLSAHVRSDLHLSSYNTQLCTRPFARSTFQHTRLVAHARHAPERTRAFKPTLLTISHARAHVHLHRAHCNTPVSSARPIAHAHATLLSAKRQRTRTSQNTHHTFQSRPQSTRLRTRPRTHPFTQRTS